MAKRKLLTCKVLGLIFILCFVHTVSVLVSAEEMVPSFIQRQLTGDMVYFQSGSSNGCTFGDKVTYLVGDKLCVSNQELLRGIDNNMS